MPNWLDVEAAYQMAEKPAEASQWFEKWLRDNYPTFFVIEGKEASARFTMQFSAKRGLRQYVHRMTGGCGGLGRKYWPGLNTVMRVLGGHSDTGEKLPKMSGLGICGGDRMLFKLNPQVIRPGVIEVFPSIIGDCPEALIVGLTVRTSKMYPTEYGLVVGSGDEEEFFTILHPGHKALALLQETADEICLRSAEFLRCSDIFGELHEQGWDSLLTVYGGGENTVKEVEHWASLARRSREPGLWRTLLVAGSGGAADRFAQDADWLAANPSVHVANCDEESLRAKYLELGAITLPK